MADDVVEALFDLEDGDEVTFAVDGSEFHGRVVAWYHSEPERDGLSFSTGHLGITLELTDETVRVHDLPSSRARIFVEQVYVERYGPPTARYHDPETEGDDYTDVGTVESVSVREG